MRHESFNPGCRKHGSTHDLARDGQVWDGRDKAEGGQRWISCPECDVVLAVANPPHSHADDDVAQVWNDAVRDYPCTVRAELEAARQVVAAAIPLGVTYCAVFDANGKRWPEHTAISERHRSVLRQALATYRQATAGGES